MAHLTTLDWIVVVFFLSLFIYIGVSYRGKAGGSLTDFFLGGRNPHGMWQG
ncbi:MAG: hypothetical protein U5L96_22360 [Owenweeksia sp.]|nr:hypothetical protein [Owenweeksia sp.]